MNTIGLGVKVKAKVSGFTGVVTGIADYLYSETHYYVENAPENASEIKRFWFSFNELEVVE